MAGASKSLSPHPRFVLDASMALSWCFPDERSKASVSLLVSLTDGAAAVPPLWFLEVSNALLVGERRKRLSGEETTEAMALLSQLPLHIDDRAGFPLATSLLSIARRYNLSAYDAAYVELSQHLGLPLATLDRRLKKTARSMGIALAV